ncbi:MAG: copper resistance protein CopC [Gemmatimonadaceae bacterium]|nr:copper resistance protein CopC [Acetobacteraceae bacterium]
MDNARTIAAAIIATALLGTPLSASEVYDTGSPYDGQVVDESPNRVIIRFTEPVQFEWATLEDGAGRKIDIKYGFPEDDTDQISVRVPDVLPPGDYFLRWMVYVTAHRHQDDGVVRFTVRPPAR